MPCTALLDLPPELLSDILRSCDDYGDLLSFSSTCRHIHAIFKSQEGPALWAVGLRSLHAFDLALIAVRSTKIVCDSLQANILPPVNAVCPVNQLSGERIPPTPAEIQEILTLQHFGHCIEHLTFLNATRYSRRHFSPGVTILQMAVGWPRDDPLFPAVLALWRERLYRNIYRMMISGAVLSAAYHAPFFHEGPDKPTDFLSGYLSSQVPQSRGSPSFRVSRRRDRTLTDADLHYLQQFPAYRIASDAVDFDAEEVQAFKPLTDWLFDDMKRTAAREGNTYALYGEELGRFPMLNQCIHALWTFEQLNALIAHPRSRRGPPCLGLLTITPWINKEQEGPGPIGGTRKTTVILYGTFQPEEITMPLRPGDEFTAGGVFTRHNLISTIPAKGLGKQMNLRTDGRSRPSPLRLERLLRRVAYAMPMQSFRQTVRPDFRLFKMMLEKHCNFAPEPARSLIWEVSAVWDSIVSMLALRHSLELGLIGILNGKIPVNCA
ncbi:hypothetical protein OQA88_901 [Cercophora sp. LCS_1]